MNAQEPQIERSQSSSSSIKSGKINQENDRVQSQDEEQGLQAPVRPALDYSSFGNFWASVGVRLRSVLTRRFVLALLVSVFILVQEQKLFFDFIDVIFRAANLLAFVLLVHQSQPPSWSIVDGLFHELDLIGIATLTRSGFRNRWAIPACAFFAWIYMRPKYHWTQLIVSNLPNSHCAFLPGTHKGVASDRLTGTGQYPASSMVKGDLFMLAGATLYGFTNATEEFLVRKRPLYEVVGQLGMYGMIINAIQASGLEHKEMRNVTWNGGVTMFILYTTAPLIYRAASSVYYNLSLLSSDFYGLLFGLGLYHYRPYWLYFVAFAVIIFGLIAYFWHSTPEEQGTLDPQMPGYVRRKVGSDESVEV
ncbi:DUF914 domain-containing membrane protein [Rhizoctonia solani AG-1 IA]|uniref:DUF914 domain-containing membrane protein n=1 Tax=Thanatephorus cucumeris (strain AG1-IA) TaxID=983506 RepID=L8WZG1_THACA|nr:DUF914 domain-containing membrane protein [Rhizoctonia solani AG-1 IA]